MHGRDINSIAYPWFMAKMWPRILEQFENKSIKLIHSMYAEFIAPFDIHDDAYKKIPNDEPGKNYVSCLIPVSINRGEVDESHGVSWDVHTIILNEEHNPYAKADRKKWFSHCDLEQVKKYTIDGICRWSLGDIIWWDSHKPHSSSNFTTKYKSKECFVVHTYV